jgi:hypothetical protein
MHIFIEAQKEVIILRIINDLQFHLIDRNNDLLLTVVVERKRKEKKRKERGGGEEKKRKGFSEVDKSLFLAPPLRHVMYTIVDPYYMTMKERLGASLLLNILAFISAFIKSKTFRRNVAEWIFHGIMLFI